MFPRILCAGAAGRGRGGDDEAAFRVASGGGHGPDSYLWDIQLRGLEIWQVDSGALRCELALLRSCRVPVQAKLRRSQLKHLVSIPRPPPPKNNCFQGFDSPVLSVLFLCHGST